MTMLRLFAAFVALLLAPLAHAQTFPPLSGRVVDAANVLTPEQEQQLTQLSADIEKASTRQFVVATIPDLQGYPIEDYGYKLGRAWGIGQKDTRNGIILIVAPNDRKVRIEVGYGLEPIMTDALSSVIVNTVILPKFRAGDMAGGIVAGSQAIADQLKLPLEAGEARAKKIADDSTARRASSGGDGGAIAVFWIILILFIVLPIIFGRARGKRYRGGRAPVVIWGPGLGSGWGDSGGSSWGSGSSWSSGGGGGSDWGGGGGFSGGGGSFGGGGASGSW